MGFTPLLLPAISENVDIDVILPKAALEFSVTDDVLLYGQFASGARNGNINSTATLGSMELFAPGSSEGLAGYGDDRTNTFEAGIKSRFADGRITLNASAYYTDYKDLQVVVATPPLGFGLLLNASKATSKGAEFDLYAEPIDNLSLFLGGSYTKAELDDELVVNQHHQSNAGEGHVAAVCSGIHPHGGCGSALAAYRRENPLLSTARFPTPASTATASAAHRPNRRTSPCSGPGRACGRTVGPWTCGYPTWRTRNTRWQATSSMRS